MLVEDDILLTNLCQKIEESEDPVVYVDTEFTRRANLHYPILSLVQIAFKNEVFIADVLEMKSLKMSMPCLEYILFSEKILKVFHGCVQDLDAIYGAFGKIPFPIFDTQVANMFCSYDNKYISYEELVLKISNKSLNKEEMKKANWYERPLSQKHLKYAEEDVFFLKDVYEALKNQLMENNTYNWFLEDMMKFMKVTIHIPFDKIHCIRNEKEFRLVNALFEWSKLTGILINEDDFKLSRTQTSYESMFTNLQKYGRTQIPFEHQETLKEILRKNNFPDEVKSCSRLANEDMLIDLAMLVLQQICKELRISTKLIGQKKYIANIIHGEGSPLLSGWRFNAFGKVILDLLDGKIHISVSVTNSESQKEILLLTKSICGKSGPYS